MIKKKSEKGQAIIIIVFSIIGMIGLIGLTVDGGMAYSDRRHAQGAADSGAWAGGLANARVDVDTNDNGVIDSSEEFVIVDAAMDITTLNGYANDGVRSIVEVDVEPLPVAPTPLDNGDPNPCPSGAAPNVEITVTITSFVDTLFAPVIGVEQVTNRVQAVTRACGTYAPSLFNGNAIVACGNNLGNNCAYDSGNSSTTTWLITGGGLFTGSCGFASTPTSVTLGTPGTCVSAVGGVTNLSPVCPDAAVPLCTSEYLDSIMPPNPCLYANATDAANNGVIVGNLYHVSKSDISSMPNPKTFSNGVYCISDLGNNSGQNPLSGADVVLDNATLYITDLDFEISFAGGGGWAGTPTNSGTYSSYAIVVARDDADPCVGTSGAGANDDQIMDYRGNSSGTLYGTILAPTACVDMRGNAGSGSANLTINSQIIANRVSSNGNATITVNYNPNQNHKEPIDPTIILVK